MPTAKDAAALLLDDARAGVADLIARTQGLFAPGGGRTIPLRGAMNPDPVPRVASSPYLADLTDPSVWPHLTTKADPAGRRAYIDEFPVSNLGVRTNLPELRAKVANLVAGGTVNLGPRVTYVNDAAGGASPRQPLTAQTAGMVAAGIVDSGLSSVNINSTTGGEHAASSRHYAGQAVDINRANGLPVRGSANSVAASTALQNAFRRQPNVRENFGPSFQEKTISSSGPAVPWPSVQAAHQNHIHVSGQQ